MKNLRLFNLFTLLPLLLFTGCAATTEKSASLSVIYGVCALLSLVLLLSYLFAIREKGAFFITLFSAVAVVNAGYFCLSVSQNLEQALWANRLSYLGSVVLPMAMLFILMDATNIPYKKRLVAVLAALSAAVFAMAASPGFSDIYYKEVSFLVINGVSTLKKVYGPWHVLYPIYLFGYFLSMVAVLLRAKFKQTFLSAANAATLVIAVSVNLGVWLIEQLIFVDFELLSVSYIITELFLLGAHFSGKENRKLQEKLRENLDAVSAEKEPQAELFSRVDTLTKKESALFYAYLCGKGTREVMEEMQITENTLKFHNKNLYAKLCVSSRKELISTYSAFRPKP